MNLRVKDICKENGITIGELADRMQMVRESLSRAINGNPTLDTLERIATALNVPITELFSTDKQDLCGHVEYKGVIYRINSFEDLEKLLKMREE